MEAETCTVNLWSCLMRLNDDHAKSPDKEFGIAQDASEMVKACTKWGGFGSEVVWSVNSGGEWRIRVFSHEDSDVSVELVIGANGSILINRRRKSMGVLDGHSVSF